jgi:PST family polysaccharide transporter
VRESGLLLSIIALRGIFHVIQGSQGWLHLSTGRPDRWKNWGIVTAIVQVLAILGGAPFGPTGVAIAFVLVGWLMEFPSISYAGRPIGIGAELVTRSVGRQLIGAIISAAAGWLLQTFVLTDFSGLFRILLAAASCISIYLLMVAGMFRLTEPIKVAGGLIQDQLSRRSRVA